jgi:hypothetical protein
MFYSITMIDDEGQGVSLAEFKTYKEADEMYDFYTEQNPGAYVDIVDVYSDWEPPAQ